MPLARYLGADEAIASRARIDEEGRYTGEMAFDAFGPAKVGAMTRAGAAGTGSTSPPATRYSDSATDIPMLEAVGHPVAVNADRELARVGGRAGLGEPASFTRPVRLRPRRRVPRRRAVRRGWGAASDAIGRRGGAAWWWLARRARRSVDAELAGGDDAEGDEDGEEDELLHAAQGNPRRRGDAEGDVHGPEASLRPAGTPPPLRWHGGGVRAPGGPHRLQSGWDG